MLPGVVPSADRGYVVLCRVGGYVDSSRVHECFAMTPVADDNYYTLMRGPVVSR
jgi:hypothetical protein